MAGKINKHSFLRNIVIMNYLGEKDFHPATYFQNSIFMKTQFQKITLLALVTLLAFSACKKDDNNGGGDCGSADEFPFMVTGHQLTYHFEELFGNSGDFTHTYGEQDANGNFKIALSGNPKPLVLEGIDFFYYRACGDKFLGGITSESGSDNWQYKADAQPGESWTHQIDGGGSANYKVLETGLTVNTLAGAIPGCAKITYNQAGTFNTDTIYWSDQVGWAKYEGFLFSYELKSKNF